MLLGIQIKNLENGMMLNQSAFVHKTVSKYLKPNGVDQQNDQFSPRQTAPKGFHYKSTEKDDDAHDTVTYRSAVGALLYLAYITRPDICFYVGYLGSFVSRPKKQHEEMLQGLLQYLKDTANLSLMYFSSESDPDKQRRTADFSLEMEIHTDADYASEVDGRKSRSGVVVMLLGCPILWMSKKQSSVTLSTASSELCAAVEGIRAVLTTRIVLFEVRRLRPATDQDVLMAIKLRMDNEAALRSMKSEDFLAGANKHLAVRYFWVKEMVDQSQLDID
jgi:hypothetical protein